jgi:hypothetical protein
MPKLNIPPLKRVPEGATQTQRVKMYEDYTADLIRMNPGQFNSDGSVKTAWQKFKELVA